jgi:arabinofuranosyltransferase
VSLSAIAVTPAVARLSVARADILIVVTSALPVAALLTAERWIAGAPGFPLDDSWIHLHFARNLAEGAGFSYNPGVPMAGSTAPLWTLLLAALAMVAGTGIAVTKIIGGLLTLAAALVTRRAALAWGVPPAVALTVAVLLEWSGPVAWGALSGMEVSLAALLVAAALWAHARERTWLTGGFAALASLARPEALVVVVLLALARPLSARRLCAFALPTIVALAPVVAFSLATVGTPVPATAAAKVYGGLLGLLRGDREPLATTLALRPRIFLKEWIVWLTRSNWVLPLVVPAVALVWTHRGRALGVPALALVLHPLAMALLAPYQAPSFQEGRYSIQLLPLAFVVLGIAVAASTRRRRGVVLVALLVLALPPLGLAAVRYGWAVQNINAMQVHLGRWVHERLPANARLAVNDIGAIAYFSRRTVVDLSGLVTPDIIPYRRQGQEAIVRYVAEQCPDYVIIFPTWFPVLAGRGDMLEPLYRVVLAHNQVSGAAEMVVYRLTRCTV